MGKVRSLLTGADASLSADFSDDGAEQSRVSSQPASPVFFEPSAVLQPFQKYLASVSSPAQLLRRLKNIQKKESPEFLQDFVLVLYHDPFWQLPLIQSLKIYFDQKTDVILPVPSDPRILALPADRLQILQREYFRWRDRKKDTPFSFLKEREIPSGIPFHMHQGLLLYQMGLYRQRQNYFFQSPPFDPTLRFPTPDSLYLSWEEPDLSFADSSGNRAFLREIFLKNLNQPAPSLREMSARQYLHPLWQMAENFDLAILSSGNLYHQGRLIHPLRVSRSGKTLFATDASGDRLKISRSRQHSTVLKNIEFEPDGQQEEKVFSPKLFSELVDALAILPDDYLGTLARIPQAKFLSRSKLGFDFYDALDAESIESELYESIVPSRDADCRYFRYVALLGHCRVEILLPDPSDSVVKKGIKQGYYKFRSKDAQRLVELIKNLIPSGLLPKSLKLVMLPYDLPHGKESFFCCD